MAEARSIAAQKLGERVKNQRIALGMSQEDMAHLAGMHWTNWGKVERGQANPSLTTIIRMAGVLNIDASELVREIGIDDLPERSVQLTAADLIRERKRRNG